MALIDTRLPLVAAPMAGGPTTVELGRAAASAGAFPFMAGGYLSAEKFASELDAWRAFRFGVNLFVPERGRPLIDSVHFQRYANELAPEAAVHGVTLATTPHKDEDAWDQKLELLCEHPVEVISFTFGLPSAEELGRLAPTGATLLASVTTVPEAKLAADLGVHGLVVQGPGAGGHSACFDPLRPIQPVELEVLVRQVADEVGLPLIAGGGVDGPAAVRAVLDAGAEAVAVGTLLLRSDEAGTSQTHRDALASYEETVITHAFTGRPARGLRNGFIDRHEASAPFGYPELHHLTRPLRQAAAAAGDPERLHLWAGTGFRAAPTGPAAAVLASLVP